MSTINFSDVYGPGSGLGRKPGTVAENTGSDVSAKNAPGATDDKKPAFYWLGFVMALIVIRLMYEVGKPEV